MAALIRDGVANGNFEFCGRTPHQQQPQRPHVTIDPRPISLRAKRCTSATRRR
jgi:hypothetical protein